MIYGKQKRTVQILDPWPVQCIGQTCKHCCCIGLWINISPSVFAAQVRPSPDCTAHLLGQMNIHVSVSRTSQSPSCRLRILVKYAPIPPALGVWTEAAICLGHYFHILTYPWMGQSQQRSSNSIFFVGSGR